MSQRETGLTDHIKPIGAVPKTFVFENGTLRAVEVGPNQPAVDWITAVDTVGKMTTEALKSCDPKRSLEVIQGVNLIFDLGVTFLGGHSFLRAVRKPNGAEFLPAGTQCFLDNYSALQAQVPGVAKVAPLQDVSDRLAQLTHVRNLAKGQAAGRETAERLQATVEDQLFTMLSDAYNLAIGNIYGNVALASRLDEFIKLFTRSAEAAQETRKDHEKVFDKAVDAVTKAIKDTTQKAPAPTPTPAPTLPDLDSIKSIAKSRGKERI